MGIKIKSVKESVEDQGLKCLVHGLAGSGKTVLSATTGEPTLIVSAEGGLLSIKNAPDYIDVVEIQTIDDLEEVYEFLTEDPDAKKYRWVNLDSVSEIAEVLLSEEKAINKDARQAYGNLSDRMFKLLRAFRDLPDVNVLFTCKTQRLEDSDTGLTMYMPMLPGKTLSQGISYLFDEVFTIRIFEEEDEDGDTVEVRYLQTNRTRKYEAKDRSGELDLYEPCSLKHIYAKIHGDLPEQVVDDSSPVNHNGDEQSEAEERLEKQAEEADVQTLDEESVESKGEDDRCLDGLSEQEIEEGYEIATANVYWIHSESDSYGKYAKGEKFNGQKMAEQLAEIVPYKEWLSFKKEVDAHEQNN